MDSCVTRRYDANVNSFACCVCARTFWLKLCEQDELVHISQFMLKSSKYRWQRRLALWAVGVNVTHVNARISRNSSPPGAAVSKLAYSTGSSPDRTIHKTAGSAAAIDEAIDPVMAPNGYHIISYCCLLRRH